MTVEFKDFQTYILIHFSIRIELIIDSFEYLFI